MVKRNSKAKRGEEGFYERDPSKAHQACSTFETAEEFEEAANKYFAECDSEGILYGEAGLALGLKKYGRKHRFVSIQALRNWYDGKKCEYLQDVVQEAYAKIQNQIETDPRYQEKGGMATKGIFMLKQSRFGGYQDKIEQKSDTTVKIVFGENMDESDFK